VTEKREIAVFVFLAKQEAGRFGLAFLGFASQKTAS